jgi:hypothetical protein
MKQKNKSKAMFLGVVEEVPFQFRKVMQIDFRNNVYQGDPEITDESNRTNIDRYFMSHHNHDAGFSFIELFYTSDEHFTDTYPMIVEKVINSYKKRYQRLILHVTINGQDYALKCVNTVLKFIQPHTNTPIQYEATMYNSMPSELKAIFAKKIAHGRLYVGEEYSAETLLLELLDPETLQTYLISDHASGQISNLYEKWALAFSMLKLLHNKQFTHGDASVNNMHYNLSRELKFIDPERAYNHVGSSDLKLKVCMQMNDIYHMLFHTTVFHLCSNYIYHPIDFGQLHNRLALIHTQLPPAEKEHFLLNDSIIFCNEMMQIHANLGIIEQNMASFKQINPAQFNKLETIDTGLLLQRLSDPRMLRDTVIYLGKQLYKMGKPIDADDLNFPGSIMNVTTWGKAPDSAITYGTLDNNTDSRIIHENDRPGQHTPFSPSDAMHIQPVTLHDNIPMHPIFVDDMKYIPLIYGNPQQPAQFFMLLDNKRYYPMFYTFKQFKLYYLIWKDRDLHYVNCDSQNLMPLVLSADGRHETSLLQTTNVGTVQFNVVIDQLYFVDSNKYVIFQCTLPR